MEIFTVDYDWDRSRASDGVSRYNEYLRQREHELLESLDGGGYDGLSLAHECWRIATSPVMSPGFVTFTDAERHRVRGHAVRYGERKLDDGSYRWELVGGLTVAYCYTPDWREWKTWQRRIGGEWEQPDDSVNRTAVATVEYTAPLDLANGDLPATPIDSETSYAIRYKDAPKPAWLAKELCAWAHRVVPILVDRMNIAFVEVLDVEDLDARAAVRA